MGKMNITQEDIDRAWADNGRKCGGCKEDYFAALYLAREFGKNFDDVSHQVAFGGNDYGFDAFHLDPERRNLYLYQFKWSDDYGLFKDSFKRLTASGLERIFGNPLQDQKQNQLLLQLKSTLIENQAIIDRVFIHFVYNGDPEKAEQSAVLDSLREDLEAKKYLIDQFFGRPVGMAFQFVSNDRTRGPIVNPPRTHQYSVSFEQSIRSATPAGETLNVGFIPLMDLYRMYREMGPRFFERNIRAGLSADRPPNRAIRQTLGRIVLQGQEPPEVFVFNHNGVTIAAERLEISDEGKATITEPRLLNGAQTVTSLAKFIDGNKDNASLERNADSLEAIRVLAKVICAPAAEFVINVTICNNRQNPVEPWNLRANDMIQLELQDKFRDELGIYYERQENSFESMSDADLEDMGIEQYKAIQIKRLAQTFLAAQGEVDKVSRLPDVFETESTYNNTFRPGYLQADARRILLAYKIQFRLKRFIREIIEKGPNKYQYMGRARNLVWSLLIQGLLNDPKLPGLLEEYGTRFMIETDFSEHLNGLAGNKVRLIINEVVKEERYQNMIAEEKYDFLRNKATYNRCMDVANKKYGWKKLPL
jgi:hypothetical protein